MKTGLVLEGGAHRAIYTAGVLDAFLDNGIEFDGVIGVSAGAIHGGSFVAKQKGRSINYTLKYCNDKRYMSWYSFFTTGNLVGEQFGYHDLPEKLAPFDFEGFAKAKTEFYAVCSNLQSGQAEYIRCTDLHKDMPYIRASASMPFVSQISEINGKKYLDGGICDSIPVRAFQNMGFDKCVVVQTRENGYQKQKNKLVWLAKIIYRKFPHFIKAIAERHLMYNRELQDIAQMERSGQIIAVRPSKFIKISHMERNLEILQAVYNLGYADAVAKLPEIKEFLK